VIAAQFSSGGFFNYFDMPQYQASAVARYLSLLGTNNSGLYNTSGRGYPKVSAYGVNNDVILDGELIQVNGASCSTPTSASVVTPLNDQLLSAGKPTLGFLNPLLYSQDASVLIDIVSGNNRVCVDNTGFDAFIGWDPVHSRVDNRQ